MQIKKNKNGQVSVEWIIIAAVILIFAVTAMKYIGGRSDAELKKIETTLGK